MLQAVAELVILEITARQRARQRQFLKGATLGEDRAVAGVALQAGAAAQSQEFGAAAIEEGLDLVRRAVSGADAGALNAEAVTEGIVLGKRHAEVKADLRTIGEVIGGIEDVVGVRLGIDEAQAPADAPFGVIRIGVAHLERAIDLGSVDADRQVLARTQQVALTQAGRERHAPIRRITRADGERAGRARLDVIGDIDRIRAAGHALAFHADVLDLRQALQAHARALEIGGRVQAALRLAQLAAKHPVRRVRLPGERDPAHVGAVAGLDEEFQVHAAVFLVDPRHHVDLRESEARLGEPIRDRGLARRDRLAREQLPRLDLDLVAQLGLLDGEIPGQFDLVDVVLHALIDIDGDVDVLFVRRDRDLAGGHREARIAAIEIPGADGLQIALQLGARVFVGRGQKGDRARDTGLHLILEGLVRIHLVADDLDLADLGGLTFTQCKIDSHAVALEIAHLDFHLHAVFAAAVELLAHGLLHLVQQRAIERAPGGDAKIGHRFAQFFLLDTEIALDIDLRDRGALAHHHDQGVALALKFDVAKKPRLVERADCLGRVPRGEALAGAHGQVIQHRARRNAVVAADFDVVNRERVERLRGCDEHKGQRERDERAEQGRAH